MSASAGESTLSLDASCIMIRMMIGRIRMIIARIRIRMIIFRISV